MNYYITSIGFAAILFYIITQFLKFYGITEDIYGPYVAFYVFIFVSSFVFCGAQ